MSRSISIEDKETITKAICESSNMHEAARKAEMSYGTFKYRAQVMGLYKPNPHCARSVKRTDQIPLEDIIYHDLYPHHKSSRLKARLIQAGLKIDVCEKCGQLPVWNDAPLTLQLDHIDGDSSNNHITNLQILCPNCHTQTPTWGSKNRKSVVSDEDILAALDQTPHIYKVLGMLHMSRNSQNSQRIRSLKQLRENS